MKTWKNICALVFIMLSGCNYSTHPFDPLVKKISPIKRDINSCFYSSNTFNLNLNIGQLKKIGSNYKTNSCWCITSKDGKLLSTAPSRIYSVTPEVTGAPESGKCDIVWIYECNERALIGIEEYGSWYSRSSQTIIFERKNNKWTSKIIHIPGCYLYAEGNGGDIKSIDANGFITYGNPSYSYQNRKAKKLIKTHYSKLSEILDPFPEGNNW